MLVRRIAGMILVAVGVLAMLMPVALLEQAGYLPHAFVTRAAHPTILMRIISVWPFALGWMAVYLGAGCAIGVMLRNGATHARSE